MNRLGNGLMTAIILLPVGIITFGLMVISESDYQDLNDLGSGASYIFFGVIVGAIYAVIGEQGMIENNRSYLANPITDVLAFTGSAFIVVRGFQIEEYFFCLIGSAIYTIHLFQVLFKNGFNPPEVVRSQ